MSNGGSSPSDQFDLRKIRRLAELMNDQDLGEIDLRQGSTRIRLRKRTANVGTASEARPAPIAPSSPAPRPPATSPAAPPESDLAVIKSPMVGTFYSAANPESPPFVKVGDHVGPETTVCIIEAMKVFNEIPAEQSGKIVAVLAQTGEPVEYGQPLFKLSKNG